MLKKKISTDVHVADLENPWYIILFTWGISHLDIEGRITGDPREYKAIVTPLLDEITKAVVLGFFQKGTEIGLIQQYSVDDKWFIQFPKFKENQRLNPDREAPSKFPNPSGEIEDKKCFGQYGWYGEGWPKRKEEIRQRDKVCKRCGKTPEENKRALEVHYLRAFNEFNGNFKEANKHSNLIALCQICHLEIRNFDEDTVRSQCKLNESSLSPQREPNEPALHAQREPNEPSSNAQRELSLKLSKEKLREKKEKNCASSAPGNGDARPQPPVFSCECFEISHEYLEELSQTFPLLPAEYLTKEFFPRMRNWCLDNRKTPKHLKKFDARGRLKTPRSCFANWLKKEDPVRAECYSISPRATCLPEDPPGILVFNPDCPVCHGDPFKTMGKCKCANQASNQDQRKTEHGTTSQAEAST